LTESNYALLFNAATDVLVQEWERTVSALTFTELGVLRFDKDLRSIVGFLADHTPWGIRDKFLRLQQISYVLNMDDEELETMDVYETGIAAGISWQLSPTEVQSVRAQRLCPTS